MVNTKFLFKLSIISITWLIIITFLINPLVKGKLWNVGAGVLCVEHTYRGRLGGICNLGILTNILLIMLLSIQAYMLKKTDNIKDLKKIGLVGFSIVSIYFIAHLFMNSSLNYFIQYICAENCNRFAYKSYKNSKGQKKIVGTAEFNPQAIGLWDYMLPVWIIQLTIFIKIYNLR